MPASELAAGDAAPDFTLTVSAEQVVSPDDFPGKWLVIYFYPEDNTPSCTKQAIDFTALRSRFARQNAVVIGISPDSCSKHDAFAEAHHLKHLLLSDPERRVIEAFGSWGPKKMFGHEYMGVIRSTFIVSPERRIQRVWRNVRVKGHAKAVLEKLNALQNGSDTPEK